MVLSKCTIKAILFDLDGTLLDTEALSDKAIIKAFGQSLPAVVKLKLQQNGDRLPWEIKKQILGLRGSEWIPMVIKYAKENWGVTEDESDLPPPPSVDDLWTAWESNLNGLCSHVEACPGAAELVECLAKLNIPLAIATSSRQAAVSKKRLRHERIFQHMDVIVAGDDPAVRVGKPAPDIYLEAARRLGVKPSECLVIEDAMSGVKAGKTAGCVVIAVPDPRMEKIIFSDVADAVIDDLWHFDGTAWGIDVNMKVLGSPI